MKKHIILLLSLLIMTQIQAQTKDQASASSNRNPLLSEWSTPYQTPPFSEIKPEHYIPAFEAAIKMAQKDINLIARNPQTATFKNTILLFDNAGEILNRVSGIFFNLLECDATPEMQEIANKVQPMITEHSNSIYLNEALFKRVKYVYEHELQQLPLTDKMLLIKVYNAFVDNGANLSDKDKEEFRKLSLELSQLTLQFGQNALAATNDWYMHITDKKELSGIPESELEIAAQKAKQKGVKGYVFDLSAPSINAIMTYADNRSLRESMFRHSCNKAYQGKYDNTNVIKKILVCRQRIAELLGYKNYAQYALHDRMAQKPENVYKLLNELEAASLPKAKKEMDSLRAFARTHGLTDELQRWDFSYYAEKQKDSLFNLNTEALKPYFQLDNVISGVFNLANELYDLSFVELKDVDVYHPDVKVYKVTRKEKLMAILYLDFHPRDTKRSGAWMTSFNEQHMDLKGNDIRPMVSLVMNFTPATSSTPSLLTFSELTTFLHEFGHALHGMLSEVPYQFISGTNTPRDFVELPSQLNENWATDALFLNNFARHYKTGELIPMQYIRQLESMRKYLAGYSSIRQLSFGYLDMMWHTIDPNSIEDVKTLERKVFDKLEVMPVIEEACMSTSFTHIFAGGYAAGYYGYKWAEMLEADAFELFAQERDKLFTAKKQKDGVITRPKSEVAQKFREHILSKGGSDDVMKMYVRFRGREPKTDALLKKSGLK